MRGTVLASTGRQATRSLENRICLNGKRAYRPEHGKHHLTGDPAAWELRQREDEKACFVKGGKDEVRDTGVNLIFERIPL